MRKTRRKTRRQELLTRSAEIVSFRASVRLRVQNPKEPEPEIEASPWLELHGTIDEPVRNVREVSINVYPDPRTTVDTARPPAVGAIVGARHRLELVISLPHADFDRIWVLALAGRLKHACRHTSDHPPTTEGGFPVICPFPCGVATLAQPQ
jgi:hypothetical protein